MEGSTAKYCSLFLSVLKLIKESIFWFRFFSMLESNGFCFDQKQLSCIGTV
jgi:hypothetical protein